MGNSDLIIIINGEKVIKVLGSEYDGNGYDEAIKIAIERFNKYMEELKLHADFPEHLEDLVRKIEVFRL
jgi:hypothetical protein